MSLLKMSFGEGGTGLVGTPAGCGYVGYRKVLVAHSCPYGLRNKMSHLHFQRLGPVLSYTLG